MKEFKKLLDLLPESLLDKWVEQVEQEHKEFKELIDILGKLEPDCRKEKIHMLKVVLQAHLKYGNVDRDCNCKLINKTEEK